MVYFVVYTVFALLWVSMAWELRALGPVFTALCMWVALSFGLAAAGYAGLGARVMGKRADGRFAWWARVVHAPFRAVAAVSMWLHLRRRHADGWSEIVAGRLWVGQFPVQLELPEGVEVVLDVTAERASPHHEGVRTIALPALDATAPALDAWRATLEVLGDVPVYVHCAAGRGRSATVAAAWLRHEGLCATTDEAIALLQARRPIISLNEAQRRAVDRLCATFDL